MIILTGMSCFHWSLHSEVTCCMAIYYYLCDCSCPVIVV